jgi:hypothetical protein
MTPTARRRPAYRPSTDSRASPTRRRPVRIFLYMIKTASLHRQRNADGELGRYPDGRVASLGVGTVSDAELASRPVGAPIGR